MGGTIGAVAQVVHEHQTSTIIQHAQQLKPFCYRRRWLKYQDGETWQADLSPSPKLNMAGTVCLPRLK